MPPDAVCCDPMCVRFTPALHPQDKESLEAWAAMAAGVAELCCGLAAEIANSSLAPDVRLHDRLLALQACCHTLEKQIPDDMSKLLALSVPDLKKWHAAGAVGGVSGGHAGKATGHLRHEQGPALCAVNRCLAGLSARLRRRTTGVSTLPQPPPWMLTWSADGIW